MLSNLILTCLFFFYIFFNVVNSQACISISTSCCSGPLDISTQINSIAVNAYFNCGTITSVTVSSTVTTIGLKVLLLSFFYYLQ